MSHRPMSIQRHLDAAKRQPVRSWASGKLQLCIALWVGVVAYWWPIVWGAFA